MSTTLKLVLKRFSKTQNNKVPDMGYYYLDENDPLFKIVLKPDCYNSGRVQARIDELVGSGTYGKVYAACDSTSCKYVMKMVKISDKASLKNFQLEASITVRASKKGFGPKVIGKPFICNKKRTGVIVMDRWDGPLGKQISYRELGKLLKLVDRMHKEGIFHQDLFNRQILVKGEYTGPKSDRKMCISDYGMAFPFKGTTRLPNFLRACDIMGLVFGHYSERNPNWFGASLMQELDRETVLGPRYIGKYLTRQDMIFGIQARISNQGNLDNPILNQRSSVDVNIDLLYKLLLQMYCNPDGEKFLHKLGKAATIERMPWAGWSSHNQTVRLYVKAYFKGRFCDWARGTAT